MENFRWVYLIPVIGLYLHQIEDYYDEEDTITLLLGWYNFLLFPGIYIIWNLFIK